MVDKIEVARYHTLQTKKRTSYWLKESGKSYNDISAACRMK